MQIIKLNATNSTNTYLKSLCQEIGVEDYTVVTTEHQTKGRGQMGNVWVSEPGKNLTFSVYKTYLNIPASQLFYLNRVAALAVIKALENFAIPKLSIKWPNDILADGKKIGGLLIEPTLKQTFCENVVMGFGINVNQLQFKNLPQATSLCLLTNMEYDLADLMQGILKHLKVYFENYPISKLEILQTEYNNYLFRKDKPSTFKNEMGVLFTGIIKQVTQEGLLQVLLEDDFVKTFDLKSITLLY